MGYIRDCRRLVNIAGGRPHPEVVYGPHRANLAPLLETHLDVAAFGSIHKQGQLSPSPSPAHPIVSLATAVMDSDALTGPLERAGSFVLYQKLLAWLIHPTQETYSRLGNFVPRPSQRAIPHHQWVDFLLWGDLRDHVIQRQDHYATPEFRHTYMASLRILNWRGDLPATFFFDHTTGALYLTDSFVAHASDFRNWALREDFGRRYPELGGLVPIETGDA